MSTVSDSTPMRVMGATPESVFLSAIPIPEPRVGEVRVKVVSSSVNAGEEKVRSGSFVGRFLHAKTTPLVLGWDFSGTVDAVGEGVSDHEEGAAVWGHLAFSNTQRQGAFGEYITIPRAEIAAKPDAVSFELAAASATPTMTALQSLRDEGRLRAGGHALIVGGGGGIGAVAIGIAKRLGAQVTAICSTRDVDRVTGLGADIVIDRRKSDPFEAAGTYDVVFDTPAVYSYAKCGSLLTPDGAYVTTLPDLGLLTGTLRSLFSARRCRFIQVASRRADLELVGGWLGDGLEVTIDSRHPISELGLALARQSDRGRSGRVIVNVAEGWGS